MSSNPISLRSDHEREKTLKVKGKKVWNDDKKTCGRRVSFCPMAENGKTFPAEVIFVLTLLTAQKHVRYVKPW